MRSAAILFASSLAWADASVASPEGCENQGFPAPEWAVFDPSFDQPNTRFVLYGDGTVLYPPWHGDQQCFESVRLSPDERRKLLGDLPIGAFDRLPARVDLSSGQAPELTILHFTPGRTHAVTVHGYLFNKPDPNDLTKSVPNDRPKAPPEFLAILDRFLDYPLDSQRWNPTRYQVRFSYRLESDEKVAPRQWPPWLPNPKPTLQRVVLTASRMQQTKDYFDRLNRHRYVLTFEACLPWDRLWKTW